jgi:hypothetical protein
MPTPTSTNWNKSPTTPKPPTTTTMVTTTERGTESTAMKVKDMAGMELKGMAQRDTDRKLHNPKRTTGASKNRNRKRLRSARSKHSVWIL